MTINLTIMPLNESKYNPNQTKAGLMNFNFKLSSIFICIMIL